MEYIATRELFSQSDIIINCRTKREAIKISSIAHYLGFKWCNARTYVNEDLWDDYKKEHCYQFSEGYRGRIDDFIDQRDKFIIIDSKKIKYLKHKIKIYKI